MIPKPSTGSRRPLLHLLSRVRAYRWALASAFVADIAQHGLALAAAAFTGVLIGHAADGRTDLGGDIVAVCAAVFGAGVAAWLSTHFAHVFAYRHQAALRLAVFDGLERSAPRSLLGERTGEIGATAMGDIDTLEMFFGHLAIGVAVAGIVGGGAAIALAILHPAIGAIAALGMLAAAIVPGRMAERSKKSAEAVREELGLLNADVVDGVQGMRELLLFGRTETFVGDLVARTRRFAALKRRTSRVAGLQAAVTDGLSSITSLAVLVVAATLVTEHALSWTEAVVAALVTAAAFAPVREAVGIAGQLAPLRASADRVLTVLDQPNAIVDEGRSRLEGAPPTIELDEVRFAYERGSAVLDGVSFSVERGETVALVGPSGGGKSTCMNLLLRFWEPDGGRISIGGRDVRSIPVADLRRFVVPIPQDVYVFHGSIADNIRLARPLATDEDVERAAKGARAHEFIEALPRGYETEIGERGARLSGGQRQRLAIARALLADAPILLLDEAASSLDTENERAIQEALREARRGRTTLVIAHRLSTIRAADRIVVLDDGRIVESGTHDELLAAGGAYARLVAAHEASATADLVAT